MWGGHSAAFEFRFLFLISSILGIKVKQADKGVRSIFFRACSIRF